MRTARELLGPSGPFAEQLEGYEHREGQLSMTEAVERAIDDDRILLCEAGTGTGKTLAYLVPALRCGRRVVVATASKALQEQIVYEDLPLAQKVLGTEVPALLVKGMGNYLCRRRLAEAQRSDLSPRAAEGLALVDRWAGQTLHGDVAELTDLPEDHAIWHHVTSSSETRVGARCQYFESCFVTSLKRRAAAAQLLVVNHHLLLADLVMRGDHPGSVLPDYEVLIIDEAHKLEDVSTSFLGHRVTSHRFEKVFADVVRATGEGMAALGERVAKTAGAMFEALNLELGSRERATLTRDAWAGPAREAYHALDDALAAVEAHLADAPPLHAALVDTSRNRVAQLREQLAAIVAPPAQVVTFMSRQSGRLSLSSCPIEVGTDLRRRMFDLGYPVVLTSASLTTSERFDFVRARLGLDDAIETPVDELTVPAPFDHPNQTLLYTPVDLPPVDHPDFIRAAAARIADLCALTPGGAFVLCTSLRAMRALAALLGRALEATLLVQGQAPKAALLEQFRRDGRAVLVATMSFWEGVDVPGAALRLVVIDRLPFPVPTDPLVRARAAMLEAEGRSAFSSDSLPRAALVLKQGYGRLIRRADDLGVVAVLDDRLCKRGYGRVLRASLPPARQTRDLEDVLAFWSHDEPPC